VPVARGSAFVALWLLPGSRVRRTFKIGWMNVVLCFLPGAGFAPVLQVGRLRALGSCRRRFVSRP
jgi:hypothetical protein